MERASGITPVLISVAALITLPIAGMGALLMLRLLV